MNNTSQFDAVVREALSLECCVICGKNHSVQHCDYIKIVNYVPDNPIPSRAKLTLPNFLEVQLLSDGSYSTVTRTLINKGTQFGPFQAEKLENLEPLISFPLKIFSFDENQNCEFYLNNNNEEKCSWLMYVAPAEYLEEQNLICYQDKEEIYYVALKEIKPGESLKVWYSPYYALKMNKPTLLPKPVTENTLKNIDVNSLIKKQQKIMERKVWNCKFCSQIESDIVSFARHILKHYTAQHKNMCEICKKTFGSKKHLKNHIKIVHKMLFNTSPSKPSKNVGASSKAQFKDIALGGPLLNDMFTDSSDLQQSDLNQFDLNLDNQNLLLDNDNLTVENLLNENVKDLDHFNFEIDDNQKQFVCDICLKQFNKVKLLIAHLKHHTGDFMCYKCLKIFCRKENLKSHICNISSQHRCTLCERKFTQKKYLSRHLQAVHDRKFHCISCNKYYYSNKELLEHNCSKIPIGEKEKFMCHICDKHFFRDVYLRKHLKTHGTRTRTTKSVNTTCEICGLLLETRNSYYLHKKKHQEPTFSCEICSKKFHRQDILKEHILTHQESVQFECEICAKKFKSKKILNNHVRHHNGARSVKCPSCGVNFRDRSTLNKHTRIYHSNSDKKKVAVEFFNCPICSKAIKLKSSLLRHLRKVHGDVTHVDLTVINPKVVNSDANKLDEHKTAVDNNDENKSTKDNDAEGSQDELDDQITSLLSSAENNLAIQQQAVDSLLEELDEGKKQKQAREVCLSIPDLTENYQEITLDKNAYILENGTIVQPQGDSDNVIIYVLDQTTY